MNDQAIRVEVMEGEPSERRGKIKSGARAGEDYCIREQVGYLHNGEPYPRRFKISLGDRVAFRPGMYLLGSASITVGDFDALAVSRELVLIPVDAAPKLAKAG